MRITSDVADLPLDHQIPGGLIVPSRVTLTAAEVGEHRYDVELVAQAEVDRYVCVDLRAQRVAGGAPVTIDGLCSIPVATIIATGLGPWIMGPDGPDAEPIGDVDPVLWRIATLYRRAFAVGLPVATAIGKVLDVSPSVAANRVMSARAAGLLEPTVKGRAAAGFDPYYLTDDEEGEDH